MSTYSQLSPICRRAMCTGESMNMARRLNLPPEAPLIPDATSAEQRHLEASLLLNWIEASDFAFSTGCWPMPSFVSATHPAPDSLAISVSHPMFLLPLLYRVLPRWVDDRLVGMPGLRVYPWRDYVELRILGAENDVRARIRLHGVNRKQGRELLAKVAQSTPTCRPLYLDRTLTPGEMAWTYPPATRLESLLSGLLRRFPLWRTADNVFIIVTETAVRIHWNGSPQAATILTVLGSPGCGIPHMERGFFSSSHNMHEITFSHDSVYEHPGAEPWEAWEAIHIVQKADRNRVAAAPCRRTAVWPDMWEDREMRDALAAREVSTIYKLLRRKGVSQRQIAAMTGQSQSEVSEILKGRQVMAYDVLLQFADGLDVPRGHTGLAYDEVTAAKVVETREALGAEDPENMKRRKFLAHAAAVATRTDRWSGEWKKGGKP